MPTSVISNRRLATDHRHCLGKIHTFPEVLIGKINARLREETKDLFVGLDKCLSTLKRAKWLFDAVLSWQQSFTLYNFAVTFLFSCISKITPSVRFASDSTESRHLPSVVQQLLEESVRAPARRGMSAPVPACFHQELVYAAANSLLEHLGSNGWTCIKPLFSHSTVSHVRKIAGCQLSSVCEKQSSVHTSQSISHFNPPSVSLLSYIYLYMSR